MRFVVGVLAVGVWSSPYAFSSHRCLQPIILERPGAVGAVPNRLDWSTPLSALPGGGRLTLRTFRPTHPLISVVKSLASQLQQNGFGEPQVILKDAANVSVEHWLAAQDGYDPESVRDVLVLEVVAQTGADGRPSRVRVAVYPIFDADAQPTGEYRVEMQNVAGAPLVPQVVDGMKRQLARHQSVAALPLPNALHVVLPFSAGPQNTAQPILSTLIGEIAVSAGNLSDELRTKAQQAARQEFNCELGARLREDFYGRVLASAGYDASQLQTRNPFIVPIANETLPCGLRHAAFALAELRGERYRPIGDRADFETWVGRKISKGETRDIVLNTVRGLRGDLSHTVTIPIIVRPAPDIQIYFTVPLRYTMQVTPSGQFLLDPVSFTAVVDEPVMATVAIPLNATPPFASAHQLEGFARQISQRSLELMRAHGHEVTPYLPPARAEESAGDRRVAGAAPAFPLPPPPAPRTDEQIEVAALLRHPQLGAETAGMRDWDRFLERELQTAHLSDESLVLLRTELNDGEGMARLRGEIRRVQFRQAIFEENPSPFDRRPTRELPKEAESRILAMAVRNVIAARAAGQQISLRAQVASDLDMVSGFTFSYDGVVGWSGGPTYGRDLAEREFTADVATELCALADQLTPAARRDEFKRAVWMHYELRSHLATSAHSIAEALHQVREAIALSRDADGLRSVIGIHLAGITPARQETILSAAWGEELMESVTALTRRSRYPFNRPFSEDFGGRVKRLADQERRRPLRDAGPFGEEPQIRYTIVRNQDPLYHSRRFRIVNSGTLNELQDSFYRLADRFYFRERRDGGENPKLTDRLRSTLDLQQYYGEARVIRGLEWGIAQLSTLTEQYESRDHAAQLWQEVQGILTRDDVMVAEAREQFWINARKSAFRRAVSRVLDLLPQHIRENNYQEDVSVQPIVTAMATTYAQKLRISIENLDHQGDTVRLETVAAALGVNPVTVQNQMEKGRFPQDQRPRAGSFYSLDTVRMFLREGGISIDVFVPEPSPN